MVETRAAVQQSQSNTLCGQWKRIASSGWHIGSTSREEVTNTLVLRFDRSVVVWLQDFGRKLGIVTLRLCLL